MPVHIGRFGDFVGPHSLMLLSSLVCGGILNALDASDGEFTLRVAVCREHPQHRAFVPEFWKMPGIRAVHA